MQTSTKLILLVSLLVLSSCMSPSDAAINVTVGSPPTAGASPCASSSEQYSYITNCDTLNTIYGNPGTPYGTYCGQKMPASVPAAYYLCSVEFSLFKHGSPVGNLVCKVYSDTGGDPGALVATSGVIATAGISTGVVELTFASPPTLAQGTIYHFILSVGDATTYDATNRMRMYYDPGGVAAANEIMETSTDGAAWTQNADTGSYLVINGDPV